jgi:hypothetical protein
MIYRPGVTACIPVHLPRLNSPLMNRAMESIGWQKHPVDAISIAVDTTHAGAAATRNRALEGVTTEFTAFLDSDDQWRPDHVGSLLTAAQETGADLIYPWFTVPSGWDPFPEYEGQPFNEHVLRNVQNYIPTTVLVRTRLVRAVGGFEDRNKSTAPGASPCEEWGLWLKLLDAGAKFHHLNQRTWYYWWHEGNTSGRGDRW